jgi:hypothetical protein
MMAARLVLAALSVVLMAGADSSYKTLVDRVNGGDLLIDFHALRLACLQTDECEADADRTKMTAMRQAMQATEFEKAATLAEALIAAGFVNIEAHALCSHACEALHQPDKARFHHDVTAALIHSILSTGDGKTQKTAFEVIGIPEEYIVMQVLGLPGFGSQALLSDKGHSFDRLEETDPKSGEKVVVFFNIDAFFPGRKR